MASENTPFREGRRHRSGSTYPVQSGDVDYSDGPGEAGEMESESLDSGESLVSGGGKEELLATQSPQGPAYPRSPPLEVGLPPAQLSQLGSKLLDDLVPMMQSMITQALASRPGTASASPSHQGVSLSPQEKVSTKTPPPAAEGIPPGKSSPYPSPASGGGYPSPPVKSSTASAAPVPATQCSRRLRTYSSGLCRGGVAANGRAASAEQRVWRLLPL